MAKVAVLGGCGAVGSVAAKALVGQGHHVVIADRNMERAGELVAEWGADLATAKELDAGDGASVKAVAAGCDVVLNCVGPFHETVRTVLTAVIEAGVDYVDVCDDVDVTLEILEMDTQAKLAGVSALIGMGSSPGATNLLAKFAHDTLLDTTESIDIFHAHGGEPFEGPGVIGHRFHCMTIDIPMFLDGELKYVQYFEPDGVALRQTFDFPVVGDGVLLYPYPHPEQVTLPNYLTLRQVTNKGTVLPAAYYDLTKEMCRLGLASRTPLDVAGKEILPYDFAVAHIIRERDRILEESQFGDQRGCCSVVAKGTRRGEYREYRFHMASASQALGEGTGIPAAMGVLMMLAGKVAGPGVFPPEGCVNPMDFIGLIPQVMKLDASKEGGKAFGGVIVEKVDAEGNVEKLDI
jgi:saccharopine dehydrogenase (NAD+, L-lysine forming)